MLGIVRAGSADNVDVNVVALLVTGVKCKRCLLVMPFHSVAANIPHGQLTRQPASVLG